MRCPYCNTLIIHKFNGNYNRMDRKRKSRHMRHCDERPDDADVMADGGRDVGMLPFSKHYAKHERAVFPTIRRRDKFGNFGDFVIVVAGPRNDRERIGLAKIIEKETVTLADLPTPLLCYDCDVLELDTAFDVREEARNHLDSFYRMGIEEDEDLTLYWLQWMAGGGR